MAVLSMIGFIVILITGVALTKARICPAGEAMESAVCKPCTDVNCGNCAGNKDICLGACP